MLLVCLFILVKISLLMNSLMSSICNFWTFYFSVVSLIIMAITCCSLFFVSACMAVSLALVSEPSYVKPLTIFLFIRASRESNFCSTVRLTANICFCDSSLSLSSKSLSGSASSVIVVMTNTNIGLRFLRHLQHLFR